MLKLAFGKKYYQRRKTLIPLLQLFVLGIRNYFFNICKIYLSF